MDEWLIWLLLALLLGMAELFTLMAALGILCGAAAVTAGLAAVGLSGPFQLMAFLLASGLGLVLVRPLARRHLLGVQSARFGVDALVGQSGYVLREVTRHGGRVRIAGEEWTARPFDDDIVIPEGATVDVMRISGSTAFAYPGSDSWNPQSR